MIGFLVARKVFRMSCISAETKVAQVKTEQTCPKGGYLNASTGKCSRDFTIVSATKPSGAGVVCGGGEPMGGGRRLWECTETYQSTPKQVYNCDAGWTLSGTNCTRTLSQAATKTPVYSCPAGWSVSGSACNRTLTAPITYSCPTGWTQNGAQCSRARQASYVMVYDKNGNITQDGSRRFTYSSYDLVTNITQGGESTRFKYDANRQRFERYDVKVEAGVTSYLTTLYVGGYEKVTRSGGNKPALTEQKLYVGNLVITKRSNNTVDEFYLHKDHQGSTTTITNKSGNVVQQFTYDPWGKQTAAYSHSLLNDYIAPAASKGYTGHEGIDNLNLIHMNGRIYDPTIGRFLQADPHIQAPTDTQSYNRYGYVKNNPMSYIDPSGFFFKRLYKALMDIGGVTFIHRQIAKVEGLGSAIQIGLNYIPFFGQLASAHFAFDASFVATGSLSSAFKAGAISYAASSLATSGMSGVEGFVVRSVAGGIFNVVQGGEFGHGFIAAGVGILGAQGVGILGVSGFMGQTLASVVIGGTASQLSGGKFANGAASAAFAALVHNFSSIATSRSEQNTNKSDRIGAENAIAKLKANGRISTAKYFDYPDDAAKYILSLVSPISDEYGVEIGGSIYHDRLGCRFSYPIVGSATSVNIVNGIDGYHTHPNSFFEFSNQFNAANDGKGDIGWLNRQENKRVTLYLGTQIDGKTLIGSCTSATCFHSPYGTLPNKVL